MAKIFVIDDAAADSALMQSILASNNHSVSVANNPVGVEDTIAAERPDLIMLDIVMPERNGYEVLRALKRNDATKDIPVILVSSKGEETDIRWGKRQGAVDYITKPYTPETVVNAIGNHL